MNARFTKCILSQIEDFSVTCPLVPNASRLISGSRPSPRRYSSRCFQTSPHDDALAVCLSFGSASLEWGLAPHTSRVMPGTHTSVSGLRAQLNILDVYAAADAVAICDDGIADIFDLKSAFVEPRDLGIWPVP